MEVAKLHRYRKVLGIGAGAVALASLAIPFFVDLDAFGNLGYIGLFFISYFSGGTALLILPSLLESLSPVIVILVGSLGVTIDEFFAWYAGKISREFDKKRKKYHKKIQGYVEKHGLVAIFILGLLPLPGFVYAVSGFAAGHYKIPFPKFFTVNFSGKLIRTTIIVIVVMSIF